MTGCIPDGDPFAGKRVTRIYVNDHGDPVTEYDDGTSVVKLDLNDVGPYLEDIAKKMEAEMAEMEKNIQKMQEIVNSPEWEFLREARKNAINKIKE